MELRAHRPQTFQQDDTQSRCQFWRAGTPKRCCSWRLHGLHVEVAGRPSAVSGEGPLWRLPSTRQPRLPSCGAGARRPGSKGHRCVGHRGTAAMDTMLDSPSAMEAASFIASARQLVPPRLGHLVGTCRMRIRAHIAARRDALARTPSLSSGRRERPAAPDRLCHCACVRATDIAAAPSAASRISS